VLCAPFTRSQAQATCNGGTNCSVSVDMVVGISYVARLSINAPSTSLGSISAADFALGSKDVTGPMITVQSNTPFRVEVQSTQSTWQYSGSHSNPSKPSSDLLWSTASNGVYNASNVSTKFMPAGAGSSPATASTSATIYFRTAWNWVGAPPGSYSLPISFTLVAP
jgi:hypothetical protein